MPRAFGIFLFACHVYVQVVFLMCLRRFHQIYQIITTYSTYNYKQHTELFRFLFFIFCTKTNEFFQRHNPFIFDFDRPTIPGFRSHMLRHSWRATTKQNVSQQSSAFQWISRVCICFLCPFCRVHSIVARKLVILYTYAMRRQFDRKFTYFWYFV